MASYGPIVILFMLPFAAAMVLLAARIWQPAAVPVAETRCRLPTYRREVRELSACRVGHENLRACARQVALGALRTVNCEDKT